jgi:hypothetical protein
MGLAPPEGVSEDVATLVHEALSVLEANWCGHATRPSARLYPHQWSWDAAFVAIGYAHVDQWKAQQELISLFRGQWTNGMLPHIVFGQEEGSSYFPDPAFWQTERSPFAPRIPRTSGIIQPPVHATAAWHIYQHASHREEAHEFLEELMPHLAAWHLYLRRERTREPDRLVEIWHPWESGMDNSPLWDDAMSRMVLETGEIPVYQRADLDHAPEQERPTDWDYDRYIYLVKLFRDLNYHPSGMRDRTPFAIWDVLYNSLYVRANEDLAAIARELGADPEPFEAWAAETSQAMERRLWDEEHAIYLDHDVLTDEPILTRVGAGFSPLFAGIPSPERAGRMVDRLRRTGVALDARTWAVPSLGPDEPGFQPTTYWRGPIWLNVNWVLHQGLRRYGYRGLASSLRTSLLELPRRGGGFWEHYDPTDGQGHGAEQFAWSAALILNLVFEENNGR